MKSSWLYNKLFAILTVSMILFLSVGINQVLADKSEILNWRMPSLMTAGPGYESAKYFAEMIKKGTNGRVNIQVYPAGALFPTVQAWDALRTGQVELIHDVAGLRIANLGPVAYMIHGLPGAWEDYWENRAFFYEHGFIDFVREVFAEKAPWAYYLGPETTTQWDLMTKVPIKKLSDYRGLKLRTVGIESHVYRKLGASTMTVGVEEIYTSLSTGLVDGTRWSNVTSNYAMAFHEVAKWYVMPSLQAAPMNYYAINKEAMKKLTEQELAILEMATTLASDKYLRVAKSEESKAWQEMKQAGVKESWLNEEDRINLRNICVETWTEEIAKKDSKWGAQGLKMLKDYLEKLGRPVE